MALAAFRKAETAEAQILILGNLSARWDLLAKYGGGGTNCSLPLAAVNARYANRKFAGCVLVSDNESWVGVGRGGETAVMTEWQRFVANQKRLHGKAQPKLVCIDLQRNRT